MSKPRKPAKDDWLEAELATLMGGAPKEKPKPKPKPKSEADEQLEAQLASLGVGGPPAARSGGAEAAGKQKRASSKTREDDMFEMVLTDKQRKEQQAQSAAEVEFRRAREEEERMKAAAAAEKERNRQLALQELERRKQAEEREKQRQTEEAQRYFAEPPKKEPPPPPPAAAAPAAKHGHHAKKAAPPEEEEGGGDDYDEDFEDYDDDFEDADGAEEEEEPPKAAPPAAKPLPPPPVPPRAPEPSPSPVAGGAGVAPKPPHPPGTEARRMSDLQKSLEAENQAARAYATKSPDPYGSRPGTASSGGAGIAERQRSPLIPSASLAGGFVSVSSSNQPSTANVPDRKFNDVAAAKQRAQAGAAAAKHRKRWEELKAQGVVFAEQAFEILSLAPLTPYEFYARGYGRVNSSPMYAQTGDDNCAAEAQTEEPDRDSVACQWPEDAGLVERSSEADALADGPPAGPAASPTPGADGKPAAAPTAAQSRQAAATAERLRIVKSDPSRLARFLQRASLVMESLLEENLAHRPAPPPPPAPSGSALSAARHAFACPRLLAGRALRGVAFAPRGGGWVLAAYGRSEGGAAALCPGQGVLCLWSLQSPALPNKVLVCEGEPTCCALDGPAGIASFAFAGTEEGSVALWDLREPASAHRVADLDGKGASAALRTPSYCTDCMKEENHADAVCRVVPLARSEAGPSSSSSPSPGPSAAPSSSSAPLDAAASVAGTAAMQLASVDRAGSVAVWLVVEMRAPDPSAYEADYALGFGARVKLLRSSRADLDPRRLVRPPPPAPPPPRPVFRERAARPPPVRKSVARRLPGAVAPGVGLSASDAAFRPDDPSLNREYVLASNLPTPLHCARFGDPPPPRVYDAPPGIGPAASATSLAFSPFFATYFLAGFSTGIVSLYRAGQAAPVRSWTASEGPITALAWSPTRPAVFFALDGASTLAAFDLLKSERKPIFWEPLARDGSPVAAIAASRDRAPGSQPALAVAFRSGALDVHVLSPALAQATEKEEERARHLLDSVL
eukprot:tig00000178_g12734.t1